MKKSLFITTVALVVPFLFSCSNKDEEIIPVSSIALSESDVTLKVGEEKRVTPTISPENATDRSLVWTSSHPNSVTAVGGLLHAYSVPKDTDKVTITAEDRNKTVSASLSVTVLPADPAKAVEADGITISKEVVSLVLDGDKAVTTISATVTPFNFEDRDVEWTSSAPSVVSLSDIVQPNPEGATLEAKKSSKVTLTGLVEGSAKVTAKCGDFSVSCAVTVSNKPDSIQVFSYGQKEFSVEKDETKTNPLTVLPYNALDGETVTYTSSDPTVAAVDSNGAVTGKKEGFDATITATVEGTIFYDSYTVHVTHPYVNFLHMREKDTSLWTNEDISLKGGSSTEYVLTSKSFNRGDVFCFCIGRTAWYKFAEVKNNAESVGEKVCHPNVEFGQYGDDIKILKTGVYTIYIETDAENNPGIWITYDSLEVQVAKLTYVNGSTHAQTVHTLDLKGGSTSEYLFSQVINAGDYFSVEFDGEYYGYNMMKEGGVSDLFEDFTSQSIKYIKCKETHAFKLFIETNPANYDEKGKAIYARADYFKYSKPSTDEWLTVDCSVKDGLNGYPEYYTTGLKLEKGANLIARINGGYFNYDLLEDGGKKAWTYKSDETYKNIVVILSGNYDIYCKTGDADASSCTGIYLDGTVDTAKNYAEILRAGQSVPEAKIGLALKEGFLDEFEMDNISLAVGDKIRFYVGDGYELRMKVGGSSTKFKAVDSEGYFECKTAGAFDLYIKFIDNDPTQLGIWAADHVAVVNVTYTFNATSQDWIFNDGAKIYLWAFYHDGSGDSHKHWYLGSVEGKIVTFVIPNNLNRAVAARAGEITDLEKWDGSTPVYNQSADFDLNQTGGSISPTINP